VDNRCMGSQSLTTDSGILAGKSLRKGKEISSQKKKTKEKDKRGEGELRLGKETSASKRASYAGTRGTKREKKKFIKLTRYRMDQCCERQAFSKGREKKKEVRPEKRIWGSYGNSGEEIEIKIKGPSLWQFKYEGRNKQ